MKTKKYRVYASEIVSYEFEVKAKSPKEAKDIVMSGEASSDDYYSHIVCGDGFEIGSVEKIK